VKGCGSEMFGVPPNQTEVHYKLKFYSQIAGGKLFREFPLWFIEVLFMYMIYVVYE